MYNVILFILLGLCAFRPAIASTQAAYEQERTRVLSLAGAQRHGAVKSGMNFDTSTILGKYFYNTVVRQTPGSFSRFAISQLDLRRLHENHPKYYLEHQILQSQHAQQPLSDLAASLTELAAQAKKQQWSRLYRLAIAKKVDVLRAQGLTYKALLTLRSVIDDTSGVAVAARYDYPLTAVYADLADAYRLGGNTEKALFYCQKLQQTLILGDLNTYEGMLCHSRTELARGANTDAVKRATDALNQARPASDGTAMTKASYIIAQAYSAMNKMSLAERFAKEGLGYAIEYPSLPNPTVFELYGLLSRIALDNGRTEEARHYLNKMGNISRMEVPAYLHASMQQLAGDIALKSNEYERAATIYRSLTTSHQQLRASELAGISVAGIDEPLSVQEEALITAKHKQENNRSRNMTVLALFTTTISIVCAIAVYRLYRHKTLIESFTRVDQLTSVDNRWFAMKAIKHSLTHMDRTADRACLALLDVDHFKLINERFGYEAGDKVLAHIAKVFKYQLRREDVIGRYGGEKFILLLVGTGMNEGLRKVDELRQALNQQLLPELNDDHPLRFSCGLVEVSHSAPPDEVIALCDTLLHSAKQRGRNQTCFSPFATPQQASCA